ncbi:hypothetical protein WMY93_012124 [Mugilogobius chulae]|uniref:Chemokine interleukin-8-like domain-containing protein n=1 Tax=Mugilogobius chulae TaxID=88201 RepID=A0AAW0P4K9_9GOBI
MNPIYKAFLPFLLLLHLTSAETEQSRCCVSYPPVNLPYSPQSRHLVQQNTSQPPVPCSPDEFKMVRHAAVRRRQRAELKVSSICDARPLVLSRPGTSRRQMCLSSHTPLTDV